MCKVQGFIIELNLNMCLNWYPNKFDILNELNVLTNWIHVCVMISFCERSEIKLFGLFLLY